MKRSTLTLLALALLGLTLSQSAVAYPAGAEQVVRMKVQQLLNMFPNIYEDIRQGRLVPGQYGQQGYLPSQQGGYLQPGQQGYVPNQQPHVAPQGQLVQPAPGQVVVPMNAGR